MRAVTLGGLMLGTFVVACFVDRPTESLTCATNDDCTRLGEPRVCTDGYCVVPNCPDDCTSCDEVLRTCQIDCTSTDDCDGTTTCPPGWTCTVTCNGGGACDDIECQSGSRCTIACSGFGACGDIRCSDACQCDLDCDSGACDSISCPVRGNGVNQVRCTADGTIATECDSTADTRCAGC